MPRVRHAVLWFAAVHGAGCGNSSDDSASGDGSSGAGAVGGSGGSSGAAGTDSGGASAGSAGSTGTPASCEAICARYVEECAMPDQNCGVCAYAVYDVPECNPPYWAYYDCLAAQPGLGLDCSLAFYQQGRDVCEAERAEYIGCSLTMGEDCHAGPDLNPNCAGDPANPPNFVYCRPEATPPPGCVFFASSRVQGVITYCCP